MLLSAYYFILCDSMEFLVLITSNIIYFCFPQTTCLGIPSAIMALFQERYENADHPVQTTRELGPFHPLLTKKTTIVIITNSNGTIIVIFTLFQDVVEIPTQHVGFFFPDSTRLCLLCPKVHYIAQVGECFPVFHFCWQNFKHSCFSG